MRRIWSLHLDSGRWGTSRPGPGRPGTQQAAGGAGSGSLAVKPQARGPPARKGPGGGGGGRTHDPTLQERPAVLQPANAAPLRPGRPVR